MTAETNRQFLLAKRPVGAATRDTFTYQQVPLAEPGDGQIVVKNEYLSLDPAMRGWVSAAANYSEPVAIGGVMRGAAVGRVVESRSPSYAVGDLVAGMFGFGKSEFFEIEAPAEREVPKVSFS